MAKSYDESIGTCHTSHRNCKEAAYKGPYAMNALNAHLFEGKVACISSSFVSFSAMFMIVLALLF